MIWEGRNTLPFSLKGKKMKVLLLLFVSISAFATSGGSPGLPLPSDVEFMLNQSVGTSASLGTQVTQKKVNVMKAVYDFTKLGGVAGSSLILRDASGGTATLPANAIVKDCMIQVITAPVGVGASIELGLTTQTDIKASTAITSYTTSGMVVCTPVGTAATAIKVGGSRASMTAFITGAPLTAGKFNVFVEYYLGR